MLPYDLINIIQTKIFLNYFMFYFSFNFIFKIIRICYTKFNLDKILNTLSLLITLHTTFL